MRTAYFIGICGTGMSATALLLKAQGWEVSGSDEGFYPPISDYLTEQGIPYYTDYQSNHIPKDADVIVIGKHAKLNPDENEEVRSALESGIAIKSYPEILSDMTEHTTNYIVAGSYGKSTCSILAAYILKHAAKEPSYFVGALPIDMPNAQLGSSKTFILEGDEYPTSATDFNAKFLYYHAHSVLLTSCAHDHVNVFPTLESYLLPYVKLLESLPDRGKILACYDAPNVQTVLEKAGKSAITYSLHNASADWHAENIQMGEITQFELMHHDQRVATLQTTMLGDHAVQNIVGVSALLLEHGLVTGAELEEGVASFHGVRRRLELKTIKTSIPIYEDFGSSYAKAKAGIETIHKYYPDKKLIVIFEPHTFSFRNREALPWYNDLFTTANHVYIFEPPLHGAETHGQLSLHDIVTHVHQTGMAVTGISEPQDLLEHLPEHLAAHETVVLLETSGDLGGIIPRVISYLEQHFPA